MPVTRHPYRDSTFITADEPRLSEAVEQYKEIGFEGHLEPVDTSSENRTSCLSMFSDRYKMIYIRPKKE